MLQPIRGRIPAAHRERVEICVDTCHGWAVGYDLVWDWKGVWAAFDDVLVAGVGRVG